MAAGDIVSSIVSVAASGSAVIQPSTTTGQWVITNIYLDDTVTSLTLYFTDGTTDVKIITLTGSLLGVNLYVTNTHYLKVVNSDTANAYSIGYDGVVISD